MNDLTQRLNRERRFLVLLGAICLALIGGALYMQIVLGEAPCPLCILQRYALLFIALFAFIGAAMPGRRSLTLFEALVVDLDQVPTLAVRAFQGYSQGCDKLSRN
uniref:Disulfide bond formation protein B n=1 Tax=Steinernema glaseri TaxID=37863 RepID=A0A1I8AFA9_9BILA